MTDPFPPGFRWGAATAAYQAAHAEWRSIARVMESIAGDETRHAALAWDIAAWIEPLLTAEERARIDAARAAAVAALERDLGAEVDFELARRAGVPGAAEARWLLARVRGELWAA